MQVGLDVFTIRELGLGKYAVLDFLEQHGFEGAQLGTLRSLSPTLDQGELKEFRAEADRRGLYTHVSVPGCNPHLMRGSVEEHQAELARQIEIAATCGWHELHASLGSGPERYEHPVPWAQHLADSAAFLERLSPVLRHHGSRIDLETHGDVTTFELVRLIERVGPDTTGICLDTANVLCHAEDPVLAARRAAPYTHLTHAKDALLFFSARGYTRQGRPPGEGCLEWEPIVAALAAHAPGLPLSIEDHKWLFEFAVFEEEWLALHPDLTCAELMKVIRLTVECERRIASGALQNPLAYEEIPYTQQMMERLNAGRDHLRAIVKRLGVG
ncbi:MAG: sugar phosphate isomerase/epimerase family protein [Armatimonadota bacterium]|nr:sugar phosphate isomerase/epimerase family protein [Armatimonadota bacterium]